MARDKVVLVVVVQGFVFYIDTSYYFHIIFLSEKEPIIGLNSMLFVMLIHAEDKGVKRLQVYGDLQFLIDWMN